ncbi:MAG: hypothetical protein AB7P04_02720 [Bacteriovoracia bacterium]
MDSRGQALAEFLLCASLITLLVAGSSRLVLTVGGRFDCLVKAFQSAHARLLENPRERVRVERACGARNTREFVELKPLEEFDGGT